MEKESFQKPIPLSGEVSYQLSRRQSATSRLLELYLWMAAAALAAGPFLIDRFFYPDAPLRAIFSEKGSWLFLSIGILVFPLVYKLIFEELPIESLKAKRRLRNGLTFVADPTREERRPAAAAPPQQQQSSYEWLHDAPDEHKRLLACLAAQSRATARGIYSRAGVYLLIGVGIAFSGLAFFYVETASMKSGDTLSAGLMSYAPRFGILFFIELIAFFFLRQYRAAMDEFRYYESLQRHREELLALVLLVKEQGKTFDAPALVKQGAYYSGKEVLAKGQTTEILEARKLEKDELELFQKMVEAIGKKRT